MRSRLHSLAIPLLLATLVFGVPRYPQGTPNETGGAGAYGSSAPNPSEQAPLEITPDHEPSFSKPDAPQQYGDPAEDGTSGRAYQPD